MTTDTLLARYKSLQRDHESLRKEVDVLKELLKGPQADLRLAIFDKLPMPVWACDRDCKIVFWNAAAARLYEYSADEAVGRDFVTLFVNEPERAQARADCIDIIDSGRPIKNMAEDITKHGSTRRLVTHCFALTDVAGYPGLQVEISYEVQDIDRLTEALTRLQGEFRQERSENEELRRQLIEATRTRACTALDSAVASVREALTARQRALDQAGLQKGANLALIAATRLEIKKTRSDLVSWDREMRERIMSRVDALELERLIGEIESNASFDI